MQDMTVAELMAMGGKTETLPNGMEINHLPTLTVGPGQIGLRPMMSAAIFNHSKEKPMQAATCEHGRPAGTPCPHCMGLNNIEIGKTPVEDLKIPGIAEGNRRRRRRSFNSSSHGKGFQAPAENNNEQRNRNEAAAKDRAKKKATLKMKKAQRRRARA